MSIVHTSYFHTSDRREDKKKKKKLWIIWGIQKELIILRLIQEHKYNSFFHGLYNQVSSLFHVYHLFGLWQIDKYWAQTLLISRADMSALLAFHYCIRLLSVAFQCFHGSWLFPITPTCLGKKSNLIIPKRSYHMVPLRWVGSHRRKVCVLSLA